ncbi:MAG: substrate-binding domain-containing protein [Bariatricus sp.]
MKWKAAALLTAICFVFTISKIGLGCTGERRNGSGQQEEFDYLITVGMVQGGEDSLWKDANTESFQSIFTEENGYKFLFEDAGMDQEKQIEAVKRFAETGVDYILLNPVAEMGWEEVLSDVKKAGSSLILVNRQIDDNDTTQYECWIGSNYEEQGKQAMKWLEDNLEREEKEDTEDTEDTENQEVDEDELDIAMIQGSIGSPEQMERAEGYQKILGKHPEWRIVGQQTAENDRETAKEVMMLFLDQEIKLDVVIAESDQMALGVIDALEEREMSYGEDGDVILISFDAGKEGLEAVQAGKINVSFECTPLLAPKTAEIIQKLEAGINIDKKQYVKENYYDFNSDLEEIIEKRSY